MFQFKNNPGELLAAVNSRYDDDVVDESGLGAGPTDAEVDLATQQLMSGTNAGMKKLLKPVLHHLCKQRNLVVVKDGSIVDSPSKDDFIALLLKWVGIFSLVLKLLVVMSADTTAFSGKITVLSTPEEILCTRHPGPVIKRKLFWATQFSGKYMTIKHGWNCRRMYHGALSSWAQRSSV